MPHILQDPPAKVIPQLRLDDPLPYPLIGLLLPHQDPIPRHDKLRTARRANLLGDLDVLSKHVLESLGHGMLDAILDLAVLVQLDERWVAVRLDFAVAAWDGDASQVGEADLLDVG